MKRFILILWGLIFVLAPQIIYAQNVNFIGSCDTPGWEWCVFVVDDYAYVADGILQIVNIYDPYNPFLVGNYTVGYGFAHGISVSGDYSFVISDYRPFGYDLRIMDVSDPADPVLAATYIPPESANDMFAADNFVYICWGNLDSYNKGLQIIDVSDPHNPVTAGTFYTPGIPRGIFVAGGYAYLTWVNQGNGSLGIINVADPDNPALTGTYETLSQVAGVFVAGNFAYIVYGESSVQIIDVADPTDPSYAGGYNTQGWASDIFVSGDYAYVAEGGPGIEVIDVSDPYNPSFAGSYDTPGGARDIFVDGGYVYVADQNSLLILQFNPQTGIKEKISLPVRFVLEQNYPNPFNSTTKISFSMTDKADVSLEIFDLKGRSIGKIFDGAVGPGRHTVYWNAGDIASGVYFYRLSAGNRTQTRRMLYLK